MNNYGCVQGPPQFITGQHYVGLRTDKIHLFYPGETLGSERDMRMFSACSQEVFDKAREHGVAAIWYFSPMIHDNEDEAFLFVPTFFRWLHIHTPELTVLPFENPDVQKAYAVWVLIK